MILLRIIKIADKRVSKNLGLNGKEDQRKGWFIVCGIILIVTAIYYSTVIFCYSKVGEWRMCKHYNAGQIEAMKKN